MIEVLLFILKILLLVGHVLSKIMYQELLCCKVKACLVMRLEKLLYMYQAS